MKSQTLITVTLTLLGTTAAGTSVALAAQRAPTEGPGVQAAADARESQVLAECPHGPPQRPNFGGAAGQRPKPNAHYRVTAIPDVIKGGEHWKIIWHAPGNNADGIIGLPNGDILIAQNNNSDVIELSPSGRAKVVYQDTDTGGALSMNKQGQLFIAERGLRASIWQLAPQHKVLANRYDGGPFDCIGGVLNDIAAASNGGVYFTQGGLYYAAPDGTVTKYGQDLRTNGIVLSPDEKTLYVTNQGSVVAFDVQSNGSLTNQRTLAQLPGGGGDGMTVDSQGRLYVTGYPGVRVISPDGMVLGTIPAPTDLISVTFGGPNKKTLFAVGFVRNNKPGVAGIARAEILTIPMEAQGYTERAK
jgi:gluconolactonase